MRRLALTTALLALALAAAPAHAANVDVRGTWDFECGGPCGPQTHTFDTQDESGNVTGHGSSEGGGVTWKITGKVTENQIDWVLDYDDSSYQANLTGTISTDGNHMSGTFNDGSLTNQPWTANRIGAAGPQPEAKKTATVEARSGEVTVRCPGQAEAPLSGEQQIKLGCKVDATDGVVGLTTENEKGDLQEADFYDGAFVPKQVTETQTVKGKKVKVLVTELTLDVAKPTGCKTSKSGLRGARRGGRLWGRGKGRFRTRGRRGAAAVRGTTWLTEERCEGTFFKVSEGTVTVTDFTRKKTVTLTKGRSYLARAPGTR